MPWVILSWQLICIEHLLCTRCNSKSFISYNSLNFSQQSYEVGLLLPLYGWSTEAQYCLSYTGIKGWSWDFQPVDCLYGLCSWPLCCTVKTVRTLGFQEREHHCGVLQGRLPREGRVLTRQNLDEQRERR